MKKIVFTLSISALSFFCGAQSNFHQSLKKAVQKNHPEINMDNKLIAFNCWSVDDQESREANKSFEKAFSVYENAKLKGGLKGIVVLAINKDNLTSSASIVFTKDGNTKIVSLKLEDVESMDVNAPSNAVYDSSGNEVYRNLNPSVIYNSINRLITR